MKHSFLDKYSDRDSVIHRLDPRTKFILTVMFILAVVITPAAAWRSLIFFLSIITGLVFLSRVPVSYILKRSLLILPFVGLVAVSVPFVKQGDIIGGLHIGLWQISVTSTGLEAFISILAKGWLSALSLILLTATTRMVDLLKGLEQMRLPRVLITTVSFMYRYIFVLTDDMLRMKQARDCRSVGSGRSLQQLKTAGNMIGTLFVRSYERGERVYSAMLSRGYDGQTRTLRTLRIQPADMAFGIGLGITLIVYSIGVNLIK